MDVKIIFEALKSIPVIKQILSHCFSKKVKIEFFSKQQFRKPPGMYSIDDKGVEHTKRSPELFDDKDHTSICITNDGEKSIRLDQIAFNVYHKKNFFKRRTQLIEEIKIPKHTKQLPKKISSGDNSVWGFCTKLSEFPNGTIIYEVIAEINSRKLNMYIR